MYDKQTKQRSYRFGQSKKFHEAKRWSEKVKAQKERHQQGQSDLSQAQGAANLSEPKG